jgi:hypothetical protein
MVHNVTATRVINEDNGKNNEGNDNKLTPTMPTCGAWWRW